MKPSTLTLGTKKMRGPRLGADSRFPAMRNPIGSNIAAELDEFDGLYLNYGMFNDSLPFVMQDQYDSEPEELEFRTAVLENDHLRATFILELGVRLWSLYDKDRQRDLLLNNTEFRPNNLAIRNAWFAGGGEYNIGRRGHDEQTCSPRFVAKLQDSDGTPVLRVYEFCRDRAVPFQIDFYLPADSRFLLARMRIMNIRDEVIPMYWWSNIAVEQSPGARVIVPADSAYANQYEGGNHFIRKIALPDGEGFDGTYPDHFPVVKDHFYNIPPEKRKYETVMQRDGTGFLFASTRRLPGRKLFVWGASQGGRHWQRKLMAPGVPDYIEIQGGLCKTQQECVPMPPRTTWEWLEAYGAIEAKPGDIFGAWRTAVDTMNAQVNAILPECFLDSELERTRSSFALQPGEIVQYGSGWGALEEARRGCKLATHLDFGAPQAPQAEWMQLLRHGVMPEDAPASYLVQAEWFALLQKSSSGSWKILLHLALNEFRIQDYASAEKHLEKSVKLQKNVWNLFALANLYRVTGRRDQALTLLETLALANPDDSALVKECLKVFVELQGEPRRILAICDRLNTELQMKPLLCFFRAYALAHTGKFEEAEAILTRNGGLEIPDIREGENSISDLYLDIQLAKAHQQGIRLTRDQVRVPFKLDLRMTL